MTPRLPYVPEPRDRWNEASKWVCFTCAAAVVFALPAWIFTAF